MKYFLTGTLMIGFFLNNSHAQFTRYIIKLRDKNGTPYTFSNPIGYLSQRAIDRRNRYGLSIDSTDLPVTPSYITQIKNVPNITVLNISKWLNAITIQTTDANALATINGFSFVQSASGIAARMREPGVIKSKFENNFSSVDNSAARTNQVSANYYNYGTNSFNEIHLHNGEFLHNIGLRGQGMQIAMLDNGFNNYTSPSFHAFDSLNADNQVLGTWDFVAHEQNVSNDGNDLWHYLTTPADGDSVIAVGAVDVNGNVGSFSSYGPSSDGHAVDVNGNVGSFSSYGPSSDGQIKPDVASIGVSSILENSTGVVATGSGTSFATPNMAGLATCLWQGFPEFDNMKIRTALWQAGSISATPNDRIGYGIPDKIADVAAQSNVAVLTNQSYQQTDSLINAQAGTVSYRIRQVTDTSAATFTAAYIDTVDISLGTSCVTTGVNPVDPNKEKITIIPNPAPGQFTLRIETPYAVKNLGIRIMDMKGRTMLQLTRSKATGIANFDLPIYRLARGKYIVSVYNGTQLIVSKELIRL